MARGMEWREGKQDRRKRVGQQQNIVSFISFMSHLTEVFYATN